MSINGIDKTAELALLYAKAFLALTENLGLVCKPEKTRWPATSQPFAGILNDTTTVRNGGVGCSGYAPEKANRLVARIQQTLVDYPTGAPITMETLAQITGKICDWSRWVVTGRFYIAPLWRLMYPKHPVTTTIETPSLQEAAHSRTSPLPRPGIPASSNERTQSIDGLRQPASTGQRPSPQGGSTTQSGEAASNHPTFTPSQEKTWRHIIGAIGSDAHEKRLLWNPLEIRHVSSDFTDTLHWWVANGIERNMVPTYLDGPAEHIGVWRAQGVGRTQADHEAMDAHSLTAGGLFTLTSDACTNAEGSNEPAMGAFSGTESYFVAAPPQTLSTEEHIGFWEYEIGHLSITERWAHKFKGHRVLWRCDNMIAVAAFNKGYSGLKSVDDRLPALAERLWALKIDVYAIHIPGVWNDRADGISRRYIAPSTNEYVLKQQYYNDICSLLKQRNNGTPFSGHTLDGYASAENTKMRGLLLRSDRDPFESTPLKGHDVWISCDFKSVPIMLKHLWAEKATHGASVKATIAIPAWTDNTWAPQRLLKKCTLITQFPPGTPLFLARRTTAVLGDDHAALPADIGPTPWPLNIWRLWPLTRL